MTDAPAPPRRVVVTGMGVLSGPCVGIDDFWAALTTPTPCPTHRKIEGFVPRDWLDRRAVQLGKPPFAAMQRLDRLASQGARNRFANLDRRPRNRAEHDRGRRPTATGVRLLATERFNHGAGDVVQRLIDRLAQR